MILMIVMKVMKVEMKDSEIGVGEPLTRNSRGPIWYKKLYNKLYNKLCGQITRWIKNQERPIG